MYPFFILFCTVSYSDIIPHMMAYLEKHNIKLTSIVSLQFLNDGTFENQKYDIQMDFKQPLTSYL